MGFFLSDLQNYRLINQTIYFRIKIPYRIRKWFVSSDSSKVSSEVLRSLHTKIKIVDNDPTKTPVPKVIRKRIEALRAELITTFDILERGGVSDDIKHSLARGVFRSNEPANMAIVTEGIKFRQVADEYLDNLTSKQRWRTKSVDDVRYSLKLFEMIFGNILINDSTFALADLAVTAQ